MGSQNSLHLNEQGSAFVQGGPNPQFQGSSAEAILEQIEQMQKYQNQGGNSKLPPEAAAQIQAQQNQIANQVNAQLMKSGAQQQRRTTGPPAARNMNLSDNGSSSQGFSGNVRSSNNSTQLTDLNILKLQIKNNIFDPKGGSYIDSSKSGSDFQSQLMERVKAQQLQKNKLEQINKQKSSDANQNQIIQNQIAQSISQMAGGGQLNQNVLDQLLEYMQQMSPQQQQDYIQQLLQHQQNLHFLQQQNYLNNQVNEGNMSNEQISQLTQQLFQQLSPMNLQNNQQNIPFLLQTLQQQQIQMQQTNAQMQYNQEMQASPQQLQNQFQMLSLQQQQLLMEQQYEKLNPIQQQTMINAVVGLNRYQQQQQQEQQSIDIRGYIGSMQPGALNSQNIADSINYNQNQYQNQMQMNFSADMDQQMISMSPKMKGENNLNQTEAYLRQLQSQFGGGVNQQLNIDQSQLSAFYASQGGNIGNQAGINIGGQGNLSQLQNVETIQFAMQMQQQLQQNLLNKIEHIFEWQFGGEVVEVCGEFNNWQGERMNKVDPSDMMKYFGITQQSLSKRVGTPNGPTHFFVKLLDPGKYMYKFRIDGNWRYAPDQQITRDNKGNENNVVDLQNSKTIIQILNLNQQQIPLQSQIEQLQPSIQHQSTQHHLVLQQLQQQIAFGNIKANILTPQIQQQIAAYSNQNQLLDQNQNLSQQQAAQQYLFQQQQLQKIQQQIQSAQANAGIYPNNNQLNSQINPQAGIQIPPINQEAQKASSKATTEKQSTSSQQQRSGNRAGSGHGGGSGHGAVPEGSNNEADQAQENIYHQNLPEENDEPIQDPQVLPIHFNYNFIERDQIPLHNDKFSRTIEDQQNLTKVLQKGFFDKTVPIPSHVVISHINSWETMVALDSQDQSLFEGSQNMENIRGSDAGITEGPTAASHTGAGNSSPRQTLTCMTIAQRLNRGKFLTIVYYKSNQNKY